MHDLRNRLGLLDVTPSKTEKRVHVYGIVSRETRDSTNINFTIARRRGAIVDLHLDTAHVYSICACEIADFAPKNSSDLHLSRGPPRRRRGVLEPPQPPPPGYAPGGTICPSFYGSPVRHQVLRDVTRQFNWPFGNLPSFKHRRVIYQKNFSEVALSC